MVTVSQVKIIRALEYLAVKLAMSAYDDSISHLSKDTISPPQKIRNRAKNDIREILGLAKKKERMNCDEERESF